MSTTTVLSADGTSIACSTTGTGPAVVFVDGALCHRSFGPSAAVAEQLAAHHTVLTYDRRGRGESGDAFASADSTVSADSTASGAPGAPAASVVDREIEDLAAVIAAAGGSAHVIAVSSGAALALRAAARDIGITRLAVYEPPFTTEAGQGEHFTQYVADLQAALADGRRGDAVARFMTFAGMPAAMVDQMRGAPMWPLFESVAPTLAHDAAALAAEAGAAVPLTSLAEITLPVLVVDGGASPDVLRAPSRAVAAAVPGAEYVTLADQTHEVAADVLAPVLLKFFA